MDTNILDGSTVFDPGRVKITGTRSAHSTPRFFHVQKFWEFIYIDKGFALLGGNGESVLLSEGDFAVVAPGENHSLVCPGNTDMHCLLFEDKELGSMKDEIFSLPGFLELSIRAKVLEDISIKAKNSRFECIRLDFSERQEFIRLCDGIMNERVYKSKGWQQLVKSYLCQSLVFYSRLDIPAKRAEKAQDGSKGLYATIIKYLEENYKNNITGAEIASQLGYTTEYLSKQFKSELDISPADYLRRYRVAKSMELLCGTDMSVSDVARECGFVDMSSYSRVFKAFEGDTPSAYRKRCRYGV